MLKSPILTPSLTKPSRSIRIPESITALSTMVKITEGSFKIGDKSLYTKSWAVSLTPLSPPARLMMP